MVVRELAALLPYIISGMLALAVALFLVSIYLLRRGRTGSYWRLRREAGQRGGQLLLASVALIVVAIALALFSGLADVAYTQLRNFLNRDSDIPKGVSLPSATPTSRLTSTTTPTQTTTPSYTPQDTSTPLPSLTPSLLPTVTSTATETALPSLTPTPIPTAQDILIITPQTEGRPPNENAALTITGVANDLLSNTAIQPDDSFAAGIHRIYITFDYQQMNSGVAWTRILYRDGQPIQGQSYLWSLGSSGSTHFFFGNESGYPAGDYEVRLFLAGQETSRFTFRIA